MYKIAFLSRFQLDLLRHNAQHMKEYFIVTADRYYAVNIQQYFCVKMIAISYRNYLIFVIILDFSQFQIISSVATYLMILLQFSQWEYNMKNTHNATDNEE